MKEQSLDKQKEDEEQFFNRVRHIAKRLDQAKPLSDEEILEISDKFIERFSYEPAEIDEIGFARAIEERHGIK